MNIIWIFALVLLFIGITYAFGALYYLISEKNRDYILKTGGWSWFCLNGLIGVSFHEISHLIFALIFRHKITGIALFRPRKGKKDGKLGYVNHTFNPHSVWQSFGNFFIGVAPMLFGGGLLLAILLIFYPNCFDIQTSFESELGNWVNIKQSVGRLFDVFKAENLFSPPMILLIVTAIFICPHLGMSGADFKGVLAGTLSLMAAGFVIPFYLTAWEGWLTYDQIASGLTVFIIYYVYALVTGLVISILVTAFNFLLSVVSPKRILKRR